MSNKSVKKPTLLLVAKLMYTELQLATKHDLYVAKN